MTVEAAIEYGRAGLRVHPCRESDKRPHTRWSQTATSDPDAIAALWARHPNALVAVCTGGGLVVVDDDRGLAEPDPELAHTLTARTRSRGFHSWFWSSERIGNAVGLLPGLDVRGEGGYVIAPATGTGWEWIDAGATIAPLPEFIVTAMQKRSTASRAGRGFDPEVKVMEGGRNDAVARFCGWALRYLDIDSLDELGDEAMAYNAASCVGPLGEAEVRAVARSIYSRNEWRQVDVEFELAKLAEEEARQS